MTGSEPSANGSVPAAARTVGERISRSAPGRGPSVHGGTAYRRLEGQFATLSEVAR